jgi:type II secretory pathway pseudopilin PulG
VVVYHELDRRGLVIQKKESFAEQSISPPVFRHGFSMIELIIVIGVTMVLIGLILPSMSKSLSKAKETRSLSAIRQCVVFFQWYTDANKEYYPRGDQHERYGLSSVSWPYVMVKAGLADTPESLDPDGFNRFAMTNYAQSKTTMVDWNCFEPDQSRPSNELPPTWIRSTDVNFPDKKGFLSQIRVGDGRIETTWCCVDGSPKGAVAWCDLSVTHEYWRDLTHPEIPIDEYGTGSPVGSTWKGVKGRDRWR